MAKKFKIPWSDSFANMQRETSQLSGEIQASVALIIGPTFIYYLLFSYIFSNDNQAINWAWKFGLTTTAGIFIFYNFYKKDK